MERLAGSDVQETNVLGVALDERSACFHVLTHQHAEQFVGGGRVVESDLEQGTGVRVHRGGPELFVVHLAQALEPLDVIRLGVGLGLCLGLLIGWGIWPVEWTGASLRDLRTDARADYMSAVADAYATAYAEEPFVVVSDHSPSTKATWGSNTAHLTARLDPRTGWIVVLCALDNLVKGASGQAVQVTVNPGAIQTRFDQIARDVERPPLDARFQYSGGVLRVLRDSQDGRKLDLEALAGQLHDRLLAGDRTLALPLVVAQPAVRGSDASQLGIRELVKEGRTAFAGSVPEKQHNIALAASRLNGVVVPPGGLFSFNKEVGPTTLDAGFQTGED